MTLLCEALPSFRYVFPSYDWDDAWLVNQIINMPKIVGREYLGFVKGVPAEEGLTDPNEIKRWIDRKMDGCTCLILFVGERTYTSDWVRYELELARNRNMGRFILNLQGMTRRDQTICLGGPDPYSYHGMYSSSGKGYVIKQYNWITDNGQQNIRSWIQDACLRAGK